MIVVRPVKSSDIDKFVSLVDHSPYGLSSLPKNRTFLEEKIANSQLTFSYSSQKPSGGNFLFVMENLKTGEIIGCCGIVSKVGGFEPFYAYNIETVHKRCESVNIEQNLKILHLHRDHSGPCEIGSLFLLPEYRRRGYGRFLALSRFLFLAQYPSAFDPIVVAKLRGVITENGESPFWEAVGRKFFGIDFAEADYITALNKKLISELMPTYPIYVSLLPDEAQRVIGMVDLQTQGAMRILQSQRFELCDMVDLFEAGPIMQSPLRNIHAVSESKLYKINKIERMTNEPARYLISNTRIYFRVTRGNVIFQGNEVQLPVEIADALQVDTGDQVRIYPLKQDPSS